MLNFGLPDINHTMKRVALFLVLGFAALLACNPRGGGSNAEKDSAIATLKLVSTPFFYTQLKGNVDNQPITMQLLKTTPGMYRGYYSFDTSGQPITIWGNGDSGLVKIYEESIDPENERFFSGSLDDAGNFKGVWHGNGTSRHFSLETAMKDAIPFAVLYGTDSASLLPGNAHSPVGMASNSILWPQPVVTREVADFIEQQLTASPLRDPQQFLKRSIDSFLLGYKTSAGMVDSSELTDASLSATWNWTSENDMKVIHNKWPLLVIEKYGYAYTGGAHGNWGSSFVTMDLSKKRVVKPADVFKPGYKEAFSPLLEKAFRAKYKIGNDESIRESLLTPSILPNDNFILTDKGVAFVYVPYEIGPYALGQVMLYIPRSEIKDWFIQQQ